MTQLEARTIAEEFMTTRDMKGYSVVFEDASQSKNSPEEIVVRFKLLSPGGSVVDSPMLVYVNKQTREARLFKGAL